MKQREMINWLTSDTCMFDFAENNDIQTINS